MQEREVPKYRKKKVKKPFTKSGHKHNYSKEVLFYWKKRTLTHYFYGTVCETCGKVGSTKYFEYGESGRFLNKAEILKKYSELPLIDYLEQEKIK